MKVSFSIFCKALLSISLVFILSIAFQLIGSTEAKTIPKKRRVIKPVIINTQKLSVTGSFSTSRQSAKRAERRKVSLTIVTSKLTVTGSGDAKSRTRMTMNENPDHMGSTANYQTRDTESETKTITTNTQRLEVTGSGSPAKLRPRVVRKAPLIINTKILYITGMTFVPVTVKTIKLSVTGTKKVRKTRKRGVK